MTEEKEIEGYWVRNVWLQLLMSHEKIKCNHKRDVSDRYRAISWGTCGIISGILSVILTVFIQERSVFLWLTVR